jgi:hydrogenase-4 component F
MVWRAPISARAWVVGMFAIAATPPFGPFFSEIRIVRSALETGHGMTVVVFLLCLLIAFLGLTRLMLAIVDGRPRSAARAEDASRETPGVIIPPLLFLVFSLWLGLAAPSVLRQSWNAAAAFLLPGR